MKTELFKISGEPKDGDMIILSYTTPRGGQSNARYRMKGRTVEARINGEEIEKVVNPADAPVDIVKGLVGAINNPRGEYCPGQFNATGREDMLVVTCSDAVSDVIFSTEMVGEGTVCFERI